MFSVAASSVILRSVSDDQRGQAQSVYQGSFIVGGMAGPAIGGLLSVISLRAPFLSTQFFYSAPESLRSSFLREIQSAQR
jgi:MFS family permease